MEGGQKPDSQPQPLIKGVQPQSLDGVVPRPFRPALRVRTSHPGVIEQFNHYGDVVCPNKTSSHTYLFVCFHIFIITYGSLYVEGVIMEFAERIRRLRRAEHLTQAQLAEKIGLTMRGYQDMELGSLPRYENLLRIADYYDVSVDWLMGRTEKREVNR